MKSILIILTSLLGAGFFFVTAWLLQHKERALKRNQEIARLRKIILEVVPPILFAEATPGLHEDEKRAWQRTIARDLRALAADLRTGSRARVELKRHALRLVLMELSQTVTGETRQHVSYLFEQFGFVREEVARLRHRKWWIRGEAARRLGMMRSRAGVIPLLPCLRDRERDVRLAVAQSLLEIVGVRGALHQILQNITEITPWMAILLSRRILAAGPAAVGPLLAGLESPSASARRFALSMLGELRAPEAIGPVYARFTRMDDATKAVALVTLGRCGDPRAADLLLIAAGSDDPQMRVAALTGLRYLGAPEVVPQLVTYLGDNDLAVARAAGEALIRILPDGKDALVRIAEEGKGNPHLLAMHYLDILATEEAA